MHVLGIDVGATRTTWLQRRLTGSRHISVGGARGAWTGARGRMRAGAEAVLPDQTLALARHWQAPVQWYQGAHLTFRGETVVRSHIEAAMQRAGWPVSAHVGSTPQEDWG